MVYFALPPYAMSILPQHIRVKINFSIKILAIVKNGFNWTSAMIK